MEATLPKDLDEALAALDADPQAKLLAGGTDLMVDINLGGFRPESIIGLRRVEELKDVSPTRVGAGVTYRRLEQGPHKALAELSRTVGSPQIRNAGTVGGNLGTASPAGDALPFLAALDAEIELASVGATRKMRWDDFITGVKQNECQPNEIITAAVLPDDVPEKQAFAKIGVRNAMVISTVSACLFRADDGTTTVALGSVATTPLRPRQAEAMISAEKDPTEAARNEFARLVSEEVRPITDHRSTEAYRRHAAGVLARRLLERCL